MSILCDYIEAQATAKGKEPRDWFKGVVDNAFRCHVATHVGKFTDSGIDSSISIYHKGSQALPVHGYLCTDSVLCGTDMVVEGGAAFLPIPKFLTLSLEDGRTVLDHLAENSACLDDLGKYTENLDDTKGKLASVLSKAIPEKTADNIRQVYFPTGEGYHLISLLTSSAILFELKARLEQVRQSARDAKDPKNERYGENHSIVSDLTAMGFGGTKPQNVSLVNNNQKYALLLNSCPPVITAREIRVPHSSFFYNTLRFWEFREEFARLHKIFTQDINNVKIRQERKKRTADIIDKVLTRVYALRAMEPGWTDRENCRLPQSQKIWLDEKRLDERNSGDTWLKEVSTEFARWFFNAYEKLLKEDRITMGQGEIQIIKNEIAEVLDYDRG